MSLRTSPNHRSNNLLVPGSYSPENSPIDYPLNGGRIGEAPFSVVAFLHQYQDLDHKARSFYPSAPSLWITTKLMTLAVLLLVICAACSTKSEGLDRIRNTGVLRIAMDPSFSPFEYVNDENELVGYDVDLALEIADALSVEAQFVTTGYDALYDALTVNRADIIISALYPDPSRTHAFAYSVPYFNAGDVLIVADDGIKSWQALGGKRIACIFGTTGHMTALAWQESMSRPPVVVAISNPLTLTDAMRAGEFDAILLDNVTALNITQNMVDAQILHEMITEEPYVVAGRIEDKALIEAIDDILGELKDNDTLLHLTDRWIHDRMHDQH